MNRFAKCLKTMVALLFMGSAILLSSCGNDPQPVEAEVDEGLMTMQADSLTVIVSEKGKKSYRFATPLLENYDQAKEPYTEFRKGVFIEFFKTDSTQEVESTLVADYAIQFQKQDLWEAKGNVVAVNADGQKLETQQLFWNRTTKRIYSNIDSKITTPDGDVIIGTGFESDEAFEEWEFRRPRGRVAVEVDPETTGGGQSGGSGSADSGQTKHASEATPLRSESPPTDTQSVGDTGNGQTVDEIGAEPAGQAEPTEAAESEEQAEQAGEVSQPTESADEEPQPEPDTSAESPEQSPDENSAD